MTGPEPPGEPGEPGETFQPALEAIEGYHGFGRIPTPVDPLQAQTAFERRARVEDYVAHFIGIVMTSGFFMLAFAVLLGFVNISNAATATMVGTILGYAIGKVDPVLVRYFHARGEKIAETNTARIAAGNSPLNSPQNSQNSQNSPQNSPTATSRSVNETGPAS